LFLTLADGFLLSGDTIHSSSYAAASLVLPDKTHERFCRSQKYQQVVVARAE
jgi:hypothetical protein